MKQENKVMSGKFIMSLIATGLIFIQYRFIPIDKVFEMRELLGPLFGWFYLTPMILGIMILFMMTQNMEEKNK